jgi:ATP-binding protein involved in chromosome partitioning
VRYFTELTPGVAGRPETPAGPHAYDGSMAAPPVVSPPSAEQVTAALAKVNDPEIRRPITELGMVKSVDVDPDGRVRVEVYLTVAGCPLRDTITRDVTAAVTALPGVSSVAVNLDVMSDEQRRALQGQLRAGRPERAVPFAEPSSLTRVYAVASGKGGVGKSSVTVNLAAALAAAGQKVGVLDADIYGFSVPRMLGVTGRPTQVEQMMMPPSGHGVKVISIGMFTQGNAPVVWRGPMLHRAVQQFLADVYWGDLDVLLMDLPPGTGDVAISVAQLVPTAELLVVTTPQLASSEVAERAGAIAVQTHQRIVGVIENMAGYACPHCGEVSELFGTGGGQAVADALTRVTGTTVPILGQVPLDPRLRQGGDNGIPLVLSDPDSPAARQLAAVADLLAGRSRGLAGRRLGLTPV